MKIYEYGKEEFKAPCFLKISDKDYFALEGYLHQSDLKKLEVPSTFNMKTDQSEAMTLGTAFHQYYLEREKFETGYYFKHNLPNPNKDFRDPKNKEFKESTDRQLLSEEELKMILAHDHLHAYKDHTKELAMVYEYGGRLFISKCDLIDFENNIIRDIKTTSIKNFTQAELEKEIYNWSYYIQSFLYTFGYMQITGIIPTFEFIFCEKKAPYNYANIQLSSDYIELANRKVNEYLDKLNELEFTDFENVRKLEFVAQLPSWVKI